MKQFILVAVAVGMLAASPAMAGDSARVHFGYYSPAPVYYQPPRIFYKPMQYVRYEPPCRQQHHRHKHGHGHGWGHERRYESAWNGPHYEYGWHH